MKRILAIALCATLFAACGSDDDDDGPGAPSLTTAAEINAYLAGKTWVMTGADIPGFPLGINENMNAGAATQCINRTTILTGSPWTVTTQLGTLTGAAEFGQIGTCDNATAAGSPLVFTTQSVLIENVEGNADCFDVFVNYGSFQQEGRADISDDGGTLRLEIFFAGQATGADCASGNVGSGGITRGGAAVTDAIQVYRLQ